MYLLRISGLTLGSSNYSFYTEKCSCLLDATSYPSISYFATTSRYWSTRSLAFEPMVVPSMFIFCIYCAFRERDLGDLFKPLKFSAPLQVSGLDSGESSCKGDSRLPFLGKPPALSCSDRAPVTATVTGQSRAGFRSLPVRPSGQPRHKVTVA